MNTKRNLWILVASTALVILGTLSFGFYEYAISKDDPADKKPEVYIGAAALLHEFIQSEDEANAKFFNKITCTKGILRRIDQNQNMITSLALEGDSSREVYCQLNPWHTNDIRGLGLGDTVCVKGICAGMINDIILFGCAVDNEDKHL
jgi:hypothetical protein